ncbi:MAG: hypothetical protein H6636_05640 [Anaerolineales bacterium]|nr:hypothetical protein [Anaerolineales bacterium]
MLYLIGLLFFSVPVLFGLNRLKIRYIFAWFWTVFASTVVFGGFLLLLIPGQVMTPREFPLLAWGAVSLDAATGSSGYDLTLVLDAISGPFALALAGLGLVVVLTSAQRLADAQNAPPSDIIPIPFEDWRNQAAILLLMGWGMLGVLAGNPLTLLLAWAGADLSGLWALLARIRGREASERIVLDFSARAAGILLLIWAMIAAWGAGSPLGWGHFPEEAHVILLLACGFRLGVVPLQVYFFEDLPLRRGVGMMTRMAIPVVSSLVLLGRVGEMPLTSFIGGALLALTAVTGLYAGGSWLAAKNELEGRAFWVLGMGALALASAIRGEAVAVLAWGLALLLGGSGLLLYSVQSQWVRLFVGVGGLMLTALPGTPVAAGMGLYTGALDVWALPFVLVHGLLLAGFVRHWAREREEGQVAVRAIRGAYALGLLILPVVWGLAGYFGGAGTRMAAWWTAGVGVILAGGLWVWVQRRLKEEKNGDQRIKIRPPSLLGEMLRRVFSFHWFYRMFWRAYRLMGGGVAFVSVLLEGEAGILWTLLLLFLLISLITTQVGAGG